MENGAIAGDDVVNILNTARRLINEGNPVLALHAVVAALKLTGGEEAVFPALKRAQEKYQQDARNAAAADELSTLLAECAIAEVSERLVSNQNLHHQQQQQQQHQIHHQQEQQLQIHYQQQGMMMDGRGDTMDMDATVDAGATMVTVPILAESGRMQVVVDAQSDGSSFVCHQCGGLVSNLRRDEHMQFWCSRASAS